jgi:secreted PhoX family phosphatase
MAAFPRAAGGSVIVYNHEINVTHNAKFPVPRHPGLTYDPVAPGGCTIVEVDDHGQRVTEYVGLAGTSTNCAGGRTPWNTWLSCEETEELTGQNGLRHDHGYVFEVDPYVRDANLNPQPIKALGRFAHEAVVVDPHTGHLYETEDASAPNGLFYRFTPPPSAIPLGVHKLQNLEDTDGTLEAMSATDAAGNLVDDLSRATEIGTTYRVQWVSVPDRDAQPTPIRLQLNDGQVTRARKLEGAWWDGGGCYFVSSYARSTDSPGEPHDGQVWFYDPKSGTVELKLRFAYDTDAGNVDGPDNITVSPYGGVIMAEDGEGQQHLFGATEEGRTYPMARNEMNIGTREEPAYGEFCGPVYSPDGTYLFANVQTPGLTYAITGPWRKG